MEHSQDAGAHPSGASDLKPVDTSLTNPIANDNENTSDSPTFFDDIYRVDFDNLDNFNLSNLDDLKESVSPPASQAAMLPNPVSASATFALEETIMDPRFQQVMQTHEFGNSFSALTQVDAPILKVLSQSQELPPPNSSSHYMSLVSAAAQDYMPAPLPAALASPGRTQEVPMPNSTLPLYTTNTTALAFNSQELLTSEPVTPTSTSFARILGVANIASSLMLPNLVLPQSLSQPVAVPSPKGRGRHPAATQPSVSAKPSKRAHPEPPAFDDVSDSEDEEEDKWDASASMPAARRSRHTSSASHSTAVLNPAEDYKERRAKNNEAVRKSRAKAKQKSQDQAQQLEVVLAENKRIKTELDHVTMERNILREMLQKVLPSQQLATETTHASSPALQEAVSALMRQARQPHAGANSPRVLLPPSPSLLRSPPSVARAHAHAHAGHGPR